MLSQENTTAIIEALLQSLLPPTGLPVSGRAAIATARRHVDSLSFENLQKAAHLLLDSCDDLMTRSVAMPSNNASSPNASQHSGYLVCSMTTPLGGSTYSVFKLHGSNTSLPNVPVGTMIPCLSASILPLSGSRIVPPTFSVEARRSIDRAGVETVNHYIFGELLGRGSAGAVHHAIHMLTNKEVAVKVVRRNPMSQGQRMILQREVEVMTALHHPNVVSLHEVIDDPKERHVYIVMDYIDGQPLLRINSDMTCDRIDIPKATMIARKICGALMYLHNESIVHRDIKPDNILVSREGIPYLCDFGISMKFSTGEMRVNEKTGTLMFMAPEMFAMRNSATVGVDVLAVDVFALGVTFYLMLHGRMPFSKPGNSLNDSIVIDSSLPLGWQGILSGMLHPEPEHRMSIADVRRAIKKMQSLVSLATPTPRPPRSAALGGRVPRIRIHSLRRRTRSGKSVNGRSARVRNPTDEDIGEAVPEGAEITVAEPAAKGHLADSADMEVAECVSESSEEAESSESEPEAICLN